MAFLSTLEFESIRGSNSYRLTKPLIYQHDNLILVVPAGFVTDLASTPSYVKFAVDDNEADIRDAAVVHDWMYSEAKYPRAVADEVLFLGMRELGASWIKAKMVFWSVRLFGGSHYGKN